MERREHLSAGKIVGAHGIRGNVKVYSYSGNITDFGQGNTIIVKGKGDERSCTISWCKPHGRHFLLALEEITTRDQAEAVAGCEIFVMRSDLPELEADTYYWDDIIGLDVFEHETRIGSVRSIIATPGNDVYVVFDEKTGKEILIPAIGSVIEKIDLDLGRMWVKLPEVF
ncbi:MAG: 16S rRNA processing protein RimM [Desulfococcus sp. 4484_241]|nr:MAG: 16S rRNA processing protein RimM [Desulfococcus sp. 4484_241]